MGEWISVEERLPSADIDVVVINFIPFKGTCVITAGLFEGFGDLCVNGKSDYGWASWETEDSVRGSVTHWMPLPEPPK